MRSTVWSRNTQWTSLWWRKSRGSERRTAGWRPTTDSPIQSMFNCAALSRAPHPGLCPPAARICLSSTWSWDVVWICRWSSQPEARKSSVRIELKWRTPPSCRPRCCLKRTNRELLYFLHHCLHQSDWRLNTSSASCCWRRRLQHHRFEWSCVFYS